MGNYTLQQAQNDIANLRGVIAHLLANATFTNVTVDGDLNGPDGTVWNTSGIQLPSGLIGQLPAVQTDTSTHTVTTTTAAALSNAWSIPASDAKAGTVYRLTTGGTGTQASGSGLPALSFQVVAFGISFTASGVMGGVQFPASTPFDWTAVIEVVVVSTGSGSASVRVNMHGNISVSNANQTGGTGAQGTIAIGGYASSTTATTTSAETLELEGSWSSNTGSPTITSDFSILERLGP